MENTLRKFYQEIRSKSRVGEYKDLLEMIEKEIDNISDPSEKEMWALIEKANWTKDHDYARINAEFSQLPEKTYKLLEEFVDEKVTQLALNFDKDWLGDPGIGVSDDGWMDLKGEVVGRGEKFFNEITAEKLRQMADEGDYHESFTYSFH